MGQSCGERFGDEGRGFVGIVGPHGPTTVRKLNQVEAFQIGRGHHQNWLTESLLGVSKKLKS